MKIGKFCSLAEEVVFILGGEHRADWITTYPFNALFDEGAHITGHPSSKGDIVVGNDVWIGYQSCILSGVTIGNGAIIGAKVLLQKTSLHMQLWLVIQQNLFDIVSRKKQLTN